MFSPSGEFIRAFGTRGSKIGQYNGLWGLAIDKYDRLIIPDQSEASVNVYSNEGVFLKKYYCD